MSDLKLFLNCITMMILWMMFLHFVADGLLQSREMGQKKSSEFKWLAYHIAIIFSIMTMGLALFMRWQSNSDYTSLDCLKDAAFLSGINAFIHAIIDSVIWRGYKLYAHLKIQKEIDVEYAVNFLNTQKHDPSLRETLYKQKVANFKYWEDHNFYSTILLDQALHMATIVGVVWYMYL